MYCPKCSQQQISEDVRFCSRCGFQLHIVSQLLETNGELNKTDGQTQKDSLYKQITSRIGAKLIFWSIVSIPFALGLSIPFDTPVFFLVSLFLFVIGLAQLAYVFIFGDKTRTTGQDFSETKTINPAESQRNLPPMQSIPVSDYESPRRETSEIKQPPPSVTEPTTKLLEIDSDTKDL